jgi:hypothetical protein
MAEKRINFQQNLLKKNNTANLLNQHQINLQQIFLNHLHDYQQQGEVYAGGHP